MSRFLNKKTKPFARKEEEPKKPYPPTITIKDIVVSGQIRAQLCSNSLGNFVDFRYYTGNTPTKRGIRMPIEPFLSAVARLKDDMIRLVGNEDE